MIIKKGTADVITYFNLVDSAAGTPETGLTIANIDATYTRAQAAAVKNDLTALAAVTTAHTDNRGIEVDATNAPGLYRIDWPDAAFATGVPLVILTVTCTGCAPAHLIVELVDYNPADGVRLGLTALPNAAADAAGGLPISDAGGLDLDAQLVTKINDILTDTGTTLDGRIPAALVSGRMDASVGAMAANTLIASALATDAVTEIQAGLSTLDAAGIRTAVGLATANLDTQLTAIDDFLDTEVAAIKAKTDNLPADPADASDIASSFSTVNTTLSTIAGYLDTEIATIKTITEAIGATGTGLSAIPWNASWDAEVQSEVDDALKATLAEGYRATGAVGSVRDMLYEIIAHMGESSISATTKTLKKIDGSTTAKTYTLDSATTPTSITETT